jgi:hypothetical protein
MWSSDDEGGGLYHRRETRNCMKHLHGISAVAGLGLVVAFGASAAGGSPALREVPLDCRVEGSNDGCENTVACPSGTTIRTARAACNLEHGPVTGEQLDAVEPGYLEVVRRSDHVDEGRCWLGHERIESGRVALAEVVGHTHVSLGCQEHDRNGGDCQIRGSLYCQ